jgi:hypothetical protein
MARPSSAHAPIVSGRKNQRNRKRRKAMGAINFNDGPPYDRLDIASAKAAPTSDGVEIALTAYVFGQPAATVPFTMLLDPAVARALAAQLGPAAETASRKLEGRA